MFIFSSVSSKTGPIIFQNVKVGCRKSYTEYRPTTLTLLQLDETKKNRNLYYDLILTPIKAAGWYDRGYIASFDPIRWLDILRHSSSKVPALCWWKFNDLMAKNVSFLIYVFHLLYIGRRSLSSIIIGVQSEAQHKIALLWSDKKQHGKD